MSQSKYKVGDKVEIVNYGHIIWQSKHSGEAKMDLKLHSEDKDIWFFDSNPELIGKVGIITKKTQRGAYSIDGIPGKSAWYGEDQLKLIK